MELMEIKSTYYLKFILNFLDVKNVRILAEK